MLEAKAADCLPMLQAARFLHQYLYSAGNAGSA